MSLGRLLACALVLLGAVLALPANAARNYTAVQSPADGSVVDMGVTQTFTYLLTNTSTGAQAGERIYEVRFRLNAGGSTFNGGTAAPAGWTRIAFSATEVGFRASSWASALAAGGSLGFAIAINLQVATSSVNESLRDIRASFTDTTTGPPFNNQGTGPINNAGGWTLAALSITSFVITDTLGNPLTALIAGGTFRLVMTVRNNTAVAQNPVASNPNPPTAVKTGTVTQGLTGTVGSPLSLAGGASGTITWTFTTAATDSGTIEFTAQARRSAQVYSPPATSSRLAVGRFVVAVTPSVTCAYPGSNVVVTLALMNAWPFDMLNVTPTLTPAAGAPAAYVSGPVPAAPIAAVPPLPPPTDVRYTYQLVTGGTTNPFTFSASARGTLASGGSPVIISPTSVSASVTRGSFTAAINPDVVNAGSTNVELTVSIANSGCAPVASVGITPPAGWVGAGDTYSLVTLAAPAETEAWGAAGAGAVVFSAPGVATQMPLGSGGDFAIVFAATPPAPGANVFTVRVTDASGLFQDIPLTVTVNAFKSGTLNDAATRVWREEFR